MSLAVAVAWLKRSGLVLAAAGLAWRAASLGMAEFHATQATPDHAAALSWHPDYPAALRGLAAQFERTDPARAEALLARSFRADPTDGGVLMRLAVLWRQQGQLARADKACELAERLFPANAPLRLQAAQYWLAAGQPQKTVGNWDLAMQINPAVAPALFPALLNVARGPAGLAMLRPVAAGSPSWWPSFMAYAAQNAAQVDTLRALYALRKAAGQPLGPAELDAYLARLMREGLWAEAYMAWLNALRPEQQSVLGYLFDGGFELTAFQGGFDWAATAAKSVQVSANYTQGANGKRALHVVLHGKAPPAALAEQTAFLLPGRYRFAGRVRPDALQAGAGLEWVLECAAGDGGRLAASERFLGSDTWRRFSVDFQVAAETCAGVKLRLQPVGRPADSQEPRGEVWFDDLTIEQAEAPGSGAPRGAADGDEPSRRQAVTRAPAQSGAGSGTDTPGRPRRQPKAALPGLP